MAAKIRAPRRLSLRLVAAQVVLLWERLMPALWPGLAVAGVFLVLALFGAFTLFSPFWHALFLALFAAAGGFALWRGFGGLVFPDRAQARRRIEIASGLDNRPLEALDDHPATNADDAGGAVLWRQHQKRMAALAKRLKIGFPAISMAVCDPRGVRFFIVLALGIALVDAGGEASGRLHGAISPDWRALGGGGQTRLDVWVSPPEYTGLAPVFLTRAGRPQEEVDGPADLISVPVGSRVEVRLDGGGDMPDLWRDEEETSFEPNGPGGFKIALPLEPVRDKEQSGTVELRVVQGWWTLGRWSLAITEDHLPEIDFVAPLAKSERMALRIDYEAGDDYGIETVMAEISQFTNSMLGREGNLISSKAAARGEIFNLMLPAPALGEGRIHDSAYHDLTAHPWAGLPVLVRLKATDGIGQTGYSSSKLTVLPAREFSHPVAAAIIEERRRLSRREGSRGGALRRHAAYNLGVLAKTPDEFGNDMVVFLGLQIARRRLLEDPAPSEFGEVQRLLWDIALRLDDDGLSLAERDFRAMIDMAREMLHTGSREGAREMLARFRETLENLQREGAPSSVFSKFMADVMPALNALMEEQQALLDESFSRARERSASRADGRSGGEEDGSAKALSRGEAQTDLRRQLDDFMNQLAGKLGEVPRELGQSSRSMGEASRALARDDLGEATDYQARALEGLRQGAKAAIETYLRQMEANRPAPEKAYIERLIPRY